jgi:hypothetical protein
MISPGDYLIIKAELSKMYKQACVYSENGYYLQISSASTTSAS